MAANLSNVVPMRDYANESGGIPDSDKVLEQVRDIALERLGESLSNMLDKVEDTLWALAEASTDHESRNLYLEGKARAGHDRKIIEAEFNKRFREEFARRARGEHKAGSSFSQLAGEELQLGLVDDSELQQTLKINDIAHKLRQSAEAELSALDQRIGVLLKDADLNADDNPLSPHAICNAFQEACRQIEENLKVKMIILKLFDDHVFKDILGVYKDINTHLVQRQVLPGLKLGGIRRSGGSARPAGSAAGTPASAEAGSPAASPAAQGDWGGGGTAEGDLYATLQQLLSLNGLANRAGPGLPAGPGVGDPVAAGLAIPVAGGMSGTSTTAPATPVTLAEVIASLTRIQQGDLGLFAAGSAPFDQSTLRAGTTNVLRSLQGTAVSDGVDQMDGMTLDIVSMLFDHILEDKRIPSSLKSLIGRMQIPVLKVAVLDKRFFSRKNHPARQMLDLLGHLGLGLPESFDETTPLYKDLEGVVERLLDQFADDISIFDKLLEDLQTVIAAENERAEAEGRRAAQEIEEKERLDASKQAARDEVRRRADAGPVPKLVWRFLCEQWLRLLAMVHYRQGTDSAAWKNAVDTMDGLVWSLVPRNTAEERRRLALALPALLKRLEAGMRLVGTDEDARRGFFSSLMRCHTRVIQGEPSAPIPAHDATASLATTDGGTVHSAVPLASHLAPGHPPLPQPVATAPSSLAATPPVHVIASGLLTATPVPVPAPTLPQAASVDSSAPLAPEVHAPVAPAGVRPGVTAREVPLHPMPSTPASTPVPAPNLAPPAGVSSLARVALAPLGARLDVTARDATLSPTPNTPTPAPSLPQPTRVAASAPVARAPDAPLAPAGVRPEVKAPDAALSPLPGAPSPTPGTPSSVPAASVAQPARLSSSAPALPGRDAPQLPLTPPPTLAAARPAPTPTSGAVPAVPASGAQAAAPAPKMSTPKPAAPAEVPAQEIALAPPPPASDPASAGSATKPAPVAKSAATVASTDKASAKSPAAIAGRIAPPTGPAPVTPALATPKPTGAASRPAEPMRPAATPTVKAATEDSDHQLINPLKIKNPFGDGDMEVEEIDLSDVPGALPSSLAAGARSERPLGGKDKYVDLVQGLKEGTWVEFLDEELDLRRPAKLSFISPLKGTYLFLNRQGAKVAECSLYQLTRDFRSGKVSLVEEVPLFERAMSGLVGVLRKGSPGA